MLLFETLLVRGGYNSGVALKWPPCSTALKYFQYPAAEWDSSCLFSAPADSILLSFSSCSPSLFSIYLSVYPCRSRPLFAVASSQSSFMPPGGEDLITYGEWNLRPVLSVPKVRATAWNSRCLMLLDTSPLFILLLRSPAPFSKDSFHETRLRAKRLYMIKK